MPLTRVEIALRDGEALRSGLALEIAEALAAALAAPRERTWVRLFPIPFGWYAEAAPSDAAPVFVELVLARPPEGDDLREEAARRVAEALAPICGRAASEVHVLFTPSARGRVAFGGNLVRG